MKLPTIKQIKTKYGDELMDMIFFSAVTLMDEKMIKLIDCIVENPEINIQELSKKIGLTYANTFNRLDLLIDIPHEKDGKHRRTPILKKEFVVNPNNKNRGRTARFELTPRGAEIFVILKKYKSKDRDFYTEKSIK
jgi:hypothetical protein